MWFLFLPVAPVRAAPPVIPGVAAVTIALGLMSSVLLCHLLCFHLYLSETHTHAHTPVCVAVTMKPTLKELIQEALKNLP